MSLDEARQLFLFTSIRGTISAAVRLNLIGPYAGQRLQVKLIPLLDQVLDQTVHLRGETAVQTAPLLDVFHMGHDRLYSRLFQS
jgi:urease accessory protein